MRVLRFVVVVACVAVALDTAESLAAPAARPNIVVILTDDMGFSDLGCQGGEIRTPNLDQLAARGIRFSQFYNNARCCPTRASLLTGLYPHQAGVGHMMDDRGVDAYRGDLNRRCVTIAEALRPAGYRSYGVGKWHVTRHAQPNGPKHNWPLHRGFDRYYGTIHGAGSFFDPSTLTRDDTAISPFADPEYTPKTYYYTDAIADHAVRFIADHAKRSADQPFFLYVAFTAAHWPMHALPEDIQRYKGRYDSGYAPVRQARLARAAALGLVDAAQGLSDQAEDWARVNDRRWEAVGMEVYAAMVDRMDQGVGKIVAELKRSSRAENTVLFYLQDNGGCAEQMGRKGEDAHPDIPRPNKPTFPPLAATSLLPPASVPPQTRDGYPVRMGRNATPGPGDTYVAYGRGWANVSNTPFREYKHWVHEGGISTPLIVNWPAGIEPKLQGKIARDPGHLIDIMATCVDLAGASYPNEANGSAITPAQGVSLRPVFQGRPIERSTPIFLEHEGNRAVRQGRWKIVAKKDRPWELYDIETDRVERTDLSKQKPELVETLSRAWNEWAERVGALALDRAAPRKNAR